MIYSVQRELLRAICQSPQSFTHSIILPTKPKLRILPLTEDSRVGFIPEIKVSRWAERPEEHQDGDDAEDDDVGEVGGGFVSCVSRSSVGGGAHGEGSLES